MLLQFEVSIILFLLAEVCCVNYGACCFRTTHLLPEWDIYVNHSFLCLNEHFGDCPTIPRRTISLVFQNQYPQGSSFQLCKSCVQSSPATIYSVCPQATVTSTTMISNSLGYSSNPPKSSQTNMRGSSDAAVIGILGGIVFILIITVIALSFGVIYYRKESRIYRIKLQAHDPPIDNPVYGTSTIASVKTQNSTDLAASRMETNSDGEEEAGRNYHVLEGPQPESSINSDNYVIPGEEDSSEDSASAQSYEVPVSTKGNVMVKEDEDEEEYREFFTMAEINKVQGCKLPIANNSRNHDKRGKM